MISIIVCSIDDFWFNNFSESLEKTIGLEHEIIRVDNKNENLSIAKAYNKGATKAIFDYLVFIHEDIIFHTVNWGNLLVEYFETLENPGVLGVVGSSYLPISPSDWWVSNRSFIHANYISNSKSGKSENGVLQRKGDQIPAKVYSLDGMFLAIKMATFLEFQFDEELPGFHGYDTDLCYQISQKYQNYFVPCILMEHFSKGQPNSTWLENTEKAKRKILPVIEKLKFNNRVQVSLEIKAYHLFLGQLHKYGRSRTENIMYASFYLKKVSIHAFHWKLMPIFFKYLIVFLFRRNRN
ncbi:glycosyltransferase [Algoriphagus yeomjeoni]|uniref:glycosyltransferase n=1 Tax=Algoriphagus yeomjeoni TaxID=291403 RepID=UPI003CE4788E